MILSDTKTELCTCDDRIQLYWECTNSTLINWNMIYEIWWWYCKTRPRIISWLSLKNLTTKFRLTYNYNCAMAQIINYCKDQIRKTSSFCKSIWQKKKNIWTNKYMQLQYSREDNQGQTKLIINSLTYKTKTFLKKYEQCLCAN